LANISFRDKTQYLNPYTKEVEVGSNQWQHRWINESGDVIYTDNESYDLTTDFNLNRNDYKRSKIRERKN